MVYIISINGSSSFSKLMIFSSLSYNELRQLITLSCYVDLGTEQECYLIIPVLKHATLHYSTNYKSIFKDLSSLYGDMINLVHPEDSQFRDPKSIMLLNPTPQIQELEQKYDQKEYNFLSIEINKSGFISPVTFSFNCRSDKRLFIPTRVFGESDVKWELMLFTINTKNMGGQEATPPQHGNMNNSFRWDLYDFKFPQIQNIRRILFKKEGRNHDCFIATLLTNENELPYIAGDGTKFYDETNLRIVNFKSYGLSTFPIINGCFIKPEYEEEDSPYYFTSTTCIFKEEKGRIKIIDDAETDKEAIYYVYPNRFKEVNGTRMLSYYKSTENPGPQ